VVENFVDASEYSGYTLGNAGIGSANGSFGKVMEGILFEGCQVSGLSSPGQNGWGTGFSHFTFTGGDDIIYRDCIARDISGGGVSPQGQITCGFNGGLGAFTGLGPFTPAKFKLENCSAYNCVNGFVYTNATKSTFSDCRAEDNEEMGFLLNTGFNQNGPTSVTKSVIKNCTAYNNGAGGFADWGLGGTSDGPLKNTNLWKNNCAFKNGDGTIHTGEGGNYNILLEEQPVTGVLGNVEGTGYSVGNVLTVSSGTQDATVTILTLGNVVVGNVASVMVTDGGTSYSIAGNVSVTGGSGSGFTLDITSVDVGKTIPLVRGNICTCDYILTGAPFSIPGVNQSNLLL
jgi:hypothetical protein